MVSILKQLLNKIDDTSTDVARARSRFKLASFHAPHLIIRSTEAIREEKINVKFY